MKQEKPIACMGEPDQSNLWIRVYPTGINSESLCKVYISQQPEYWPQLIRYSSDDEAAEKSIQKAATAMKGALSNYRKTLTAATSDDSLVTEYQFISKVPSSQIEEYTEKLYNTMQDRALSIPLEKRKGPMNNTYVQATQDSLNIKWQSLPDDLADDAKKIILDSRHALVDAAIKQHNVNAQMIDLPTTNWRSRMAVANNALEAADEAHASAYLSISPEADPAAMMTYHQNDVNAVIAALEIFKNKRFLEDIGSIQPSPRR